ncbi:hypothetical protein ACTMU2_05980 [Cupriavidus basilensis]
MLRMQVDIPQALANLIAKGLTQLNSALVPLLADMTSALADDLRAAGAAGTYAGPHLCRVAQRSVARGHRQRHLRRHPSSRLSTAGCRRSRCSPASFSTRTSGMASMPSART